MYVGLRMIVGEKRSGQAIEIKKQGVKNALLVQREEL